MAHSLMQGQPLPGVLMHQRVASALAAPLGKDAAACKVVLAVRAAALLCSMQATVVELHCHKQQQQQH
jgi:hypothetical protein